MPVNPSHYGLLDVPAPGEMSACPLCFVRLSVFPCLMERRRGLERQCQPQIFKTIHAGLPWVSWLSRKCYFLARTKRLLKANLSRRSAELWAWVFSLFRCESWSQNKSFWESRLNHGGLKNTGSHRQWECKHHRKRLHAWNCWHTTYQPEKIHNHLESKIRHYGTLAKQLVRLNYLNCIVLSH